MRGQRGAREKDFPKMRVILWHSTYCDYYKTSVKMQVADFQHTSFYAHGSFLKQSNHYVSTDWTLISGSFFLIEEATSMLESPVWFSRLPPVLLQSFPARLTVDAFEGGLKPRRWRRKATSVGTFPTRKKNRAGESHLWGRSAYNEIEKVVEKGRFARHLPMWKGPQRHRIAGNAAVAEAGWSGKWLSPSEKYS